MISRSLLRKFFFRICIIPTYLSSSSEAFVRPTEGSHRQPLRQEILLSLALNQNDKYVSYLHKCGGKIALFSNRRISLKIALFERSEFAILEIQDLENTNFFSL